MLHAHIYIHIIHNKARNYIIHEFNVVAFTTLHLQMLASSSALDIPCPSSQVDKTHVSFCKDTTVWLKTGPQGLESLEDLVAMTCPSEV